MAGTLHSTTPLLVETPKTYLTTTQFTLVATLAHARSSALQATTVPTTPNTPTAATATSTAPHRSLIHQALLMSAAIQHASHTPTRTVIMLWRSTMLRMVRLGAALRTPALAPWPSHASRITQIEYLAFTKAIPGSVSGEKMYSLRGDSQSIQLYVATFI